MKAIFSKEASKFFIKLRQSDQDKISKALNKLLKDPFTGEKLKGELSGRFKLYAWPYRIIYKFYEQDKIIEIITIGHRQGVYK